MTLLLCTSTRDTSWTFTEVSSSQITATKDYLFFWWCHFPKQKQKIFINMCHHKDFGISVEWHFSATAHGKGTCDGLGGTVKWLAACASSQKPYDDQMTPRQLFDWATINIPTIHFDSCSSDDYEAEKIDIEQWFLRARTIPGTCKLHSFIPVSKGKLQVKQFSAASSCKEESHCFWRWDTSRINCRIRYMLNWQWWFGLCSSPKSRWKSS